MNTPAKNTLAMVIPSLRYRDAPAMVDWSCKAFGFQKHAVYADGVTVHHAQLTLGHGMITPGSATGDSARGQRIVQPGETGNRETQACYTVVADCAAHRAQAKAAGAEIVDELETRDCGGSGYSSRDPEAHLWSSGDDDPWAESST